MGELQIKIISLKGLLMEIKTTIAILSFIVTIFNIFGISLIGLYLTTKSRVFNSFDKMHSLFRELEDVRKPYLNRKPNHVKIADLQLQIKHIMIQIIELHKWNIIKLSQSQYRMMADCCEEFLYFNDAQRYWEKCFSFKFPIKEIESEYHCRYGQFLYHICDFPNGINEFKKALELDNDGDGRKYINADTNVKWALCTLNAMNNVLCCNPQHDVSDLTLFISEKLNDAERLFNSIKDYGLKKSGLDTIADIRVKHFPLKEISDRDHHEVSL